MKRLLGVNWAKPRTAPRLKSGGTGKCFPIKKNPPGLTGNYPYMDCFSDAARKYNLPVPLLVAMARGESGFDPDARSHKECLGLMQIKWPGTANDLGIMHREDLFNPAVSIDAGARYMSWLVDQFDGDLFLAVAAYNYGPNAISPKRRVPSGAKWYAAYIFPAFKSGAVQTLRESPPGTHHAV